MIFFQKIFLIIVEHELRNLRVFLQFFLKLSIMDIFENPCLRNVSYSHLDLIMEPVGLPNEYSVTIVTSEFSLDQFRIMVGD